jgi:hypothetical protein
VTGKRGSPRLDHFRRDFNFGGEGAVSDHAKNYPHLGTFTSNLAKVLKLQHIVAVVSTT